MTKTFLSRLIADFHRRQAMKALHDSQKRVSIKLARYNAHMAAARRLAVHG